jgi:hypothetical protein
MLRLSPRRNEERSNLSYVDRFAAAGAPFFFFMMAALLDIATGTETADIAKPS